MVSSCLCGSPKFHLKIVYKLNPLYSWFFIASRCGLLSPVFHNKHLLVATACIICNSFRNLCWWDPFYSLSQLQLSSVCHCVGHTVDKVILSLGSVVYLKKITVLKKKLKGKWCRCDCPDSTPIQFFCSLSARCHPEVAISEQLLDHKFGLLLLCGSQLWVCVHGEAATTLWLCLSSFFMWIPLADRL